MKNKKMQIGIMLFIAIWILQANAVLAAPVDSGATGAATNSQDPNEGKFTIYPSYMHGQNSSWIITDTSTDETVQDYVTIENLSNTTETISLYVREAKTQDEKFIPIDDNSFKNLGAWTKLPQSTFTLAAKEKIKVPFTINIPKDATKKEYQGVIFAVKENTAATPNHGSAPIKMVTRIGVRMYINVDQKSFFNSNYFNSPSYKNGLFFVLSLSGLIAAGCYNLIHYLENKKYAKKH